MPTQSSVLTVEYKLNLVAPAVGERLVARAEVVRNGKTLKVCRADVFGVKDGVETLCAVMLSTIMTMFDRKDS
jgi:acyl-coenzyme A thioesterase PaaI-like protein